MIEKESFIRFSSFIEHLVKFKFVSLARERLRLLLEEKLSP